MNIILSVYENEYKGKKYINYRLYADLEYCKKTIAFKSSDICEFLDCSPSYLTNLSVGEYKVGILDIEK